MHKTWACGQKDFPSSGKIRADLKTTEIPPLRSAKEYRVSRRMGQGIQNISTDRNSAGFRIYPIKPGRVRVKMIPHHGQITKRPLMDKAPEWRIS